MKKIISQTYSMSDAYTKRATEREWTIEREREWKGQDIFQLSY